MKNREKWLKLMIAFGPVALVFFLHFLLTEIYGSFTYRHDLSEKTRVLGVFQPLNRLYPPLENPRIDSQSVEYFSLPTVLTQTYDEQSSATMENK